jgi:hypothetical protein
MPEDRKTVHFIAVLRSPCISVLCCLSSHCHPTRSASKGRGDRQSALINSPLTSVVRRLWSVLRHLILPLMHKHFQDMDSLGREKGMRSVPLARVLHPDFGLFSPSPGSLRKLGIAVVFIAIGLIAGTNGILVLLSDEEPEARDAFALAPSEPRMPAAATGETAERVIPPIAERVIPPIAGRVPPTIATTPQKPEPQKPEPKVIRVERKPMQSIGPNKAEAKSSCSLQAGGNCASSEPTVPPPASDRAAMLPAEAIPSTTVPGEPIAVVPAEPARALPEPASAVVAPETETVVRPPRASRRTGYSGSRNHAESSRAHAQAPARRSGGYAVLW